MIVTPDNVEPDLDTGVRFDEEWELVILSDRGAVDGHDSVARENSGTGGRSTCPRLDDGVKEGFDSRHAEAVEIVNAEGDRDLGNGTVSLDLQQDLSAASGQQGDLEVTPVIGRFSLHRPHEVSLANTGEVGARTRLHPTDNRRIIEVGLDLNTDNKSEGYETDRCNDIGERSGK